MDIQNIQYGTRKSSHFPALIHMAVTSLAIGGNPLVSPWAGVSFLGGLAVWLLWGEETEIAPNLNTWAKLGLLGDEGKEICNYMGQQEAGCHCEHNVSKWMNHCDSGWDISATNISCLQLMLHLFFSTPPPNSAFQNPSDILERNLLLSRHTW